MKNSWKSLTGQAILHFRRHASRRVPSTRFGEIAGSSRNVSQDKQVTGPTARRKIRVNWLASRNWRLGSSSADPGIRGFREPTVALEATNFKLSLLTAALPTVNATFGLPT